MLRANDPNSNASFQLTLFEDDLINRFDVVNSTGQLQTIWFRAEVPVRKWNTMCLVRDTGIVCLCQHIFYQIPKLCGSYSWMQYAFRFFKKSGNEFRLKASIKKHYTCILGLDFNDDQVNRFDIYQNNENVYSYGNCKTVGPVSDYYKSQVKDQKCHNHTNWKLKVNIFYSYFIL